MFSFVFINVFVGNREIASLELLCKPKVQVSMDGAAGSCNEFALKFIDWLCAFFFPPDSCVESL